MLCHTKHISRVSTRPFRHTDERNYDMEFDTLINWKVVHIHLGLQGFFCQVFYIAYIVMGSSMVLVNTESIIKFLLYDLQSPCLIHGQEACNKLLDENYMTVPKFGRKNGG